MSVRIGTWKRALISASTRRPSSRPGPRKERPEVRFALSYDALKINGTRVRRAISTRRPARSSACASLSITQGPAISTKGLPPPIVMSPSCKGVTNGLYRSGRSRRSGEPGRSRLQALTYQTDLTHLAHQTVLGLVLIRGGDERGEQGMRPRRLR